jgi:hypothetical protein
MIKKNDGVESVVGRMLHLQAECENLATLVAIKGTTVHALA